MSKRKKRKKRSLSPAVVLRPRLDNLWADAALLHKDDPAIEKDLDTVARGIAPDIVTKTVLRAYLAASAPARARLDSVLPRWLSKHDYVSTLKEMMAAQLLDSDLRSQALAWMTSLGIDTESIDNLPSLFFRAYYYDDEALLGEKSQAYAMVFWYTSPKKHRARGLGFLLDYNPPWDGSVKDVIVAPRRPPEKLIRGVLDIWKRGDMEPDTVSPERVKTVILTALNCNRVANLRLPRDLIDARETFDRHVMALPDTPDTPAFTMDDFDILVRKGKRPEEIMHFEQTVGRRVRLPDGEVLVVGNSDWDDEEWVDE
ncbi:MAG: hypothetical protein GY832_35640 [Chloroflexi bacterium]|nr:hypothetical protein [Chloroflexota bacterium]